MSNTDQHEFEVHVSIVKKNDPTWVPPMTLSGSVQVVKELPEGIGDQVLRLELTSLLTHFAQITTASQYTVKGEH